MASVNMFIDSPSWPVEDTYVHTSYEGESDEKTVDSVIGFSKLINNFNVKQKIVLYRPSYTGLQKAKPVNIICELYPDQYDSVRDKLRDDILLIELVMN